MIAIETEYKGILFRSRLEARWAILFDAFNLKWIYEPECFILSNGQKYTPDFYLQDIKVYVEIKPNYDWVDDKYHSERYELFEGDLLILSGGYPNFNTNLLFHKQIWTDETTTSRELQVVVFLPNKNKYGHFWFSGYDEDSNEDGFEEYYTKELHEVKKYRFYK